MPWLAYIPGCCKSGDEIQEHGLNAEPLKITASQM